jgi:hypothetical protein
MTGMKRKKRKTRTGAQTLPRPELNHSSRAQLGPDPEQRPYRPRDDDASVEDPLKDWPEKS